MYKNIIIKCFRINILFISIPVLLLLLTACDKDTTQDTSNLEPHSIEQDHKHVESSYVCPMHAQIISTEAGTCPICGMSLVKQTNAHKPALSEKIPVVELTPEIIQTLGIRTETVKKGSLSKTIKTVGYVSYNKHRVKLVRSHTSGWVENLVFRNEGQSVKKGNLMLELYSPEFLAVQEQFIKAQKSDKSDILKKYGQRVESRPTRDYLRYLNVSESLINEIARTGKSKYRIPVYAPQYGVLVRHNVHKHQFITPGYIMFVIADTSSVWVEADIYEHQLPWIRRGLSAQIELQALPGKKWPARVNYIYPELDPQSRTLKVRLLVSTPDGLLKPNMFAQVKIITDPVKDTLIIPREALIVTGERQSVIRNLGNGRFQPVDVRTGLNSGGQVEILSGLQEGDKIVTSGQFLIDSEANLQASFQRLNSSHE